MSREAEHPSAVERVLCEWFLLSEEGQEPNLQELCGGDLELAQKAQKLLGGEPEFLRQRGESAGVGEPDHDDEWSGMRLDDFRIVRRIASGGMGTVFLAEQERLGRKVALKVVDKSWVATPQAYQRLRREAAIAASLNHPNIVPVYAVGEEGDKCFIAMRHLTGPPLSEIDLPIDPQRAARICLALAEALDAAHSAGVVHRDVKPANILLDDETPFLVDFGLARSSVDPTLTSQGSVPGTLPYMAPELLSREAPVLDPRTDVYALGVTLYEFLVGRPPFLGSQTVATVRKILLQDAPALGLARRHRDLETIVLRALEKSPRRRIPSARAFADDLQRFLNDEPVASQPTSHLYRLARRMRRYPRVAIFALFSFVVVVALTISTALARRGEQRALRSGVHLVQADLDEGRVERAGLTLVSLVERHKDSAEVSGLAKRVAAEVAADRLFAALFQRPLLLDWQGLNRALEEAKRAQALTHIPDRAGPLFAVADWCLGREERAGKSLHALLEGGRAPLAAASLAELLGAEPQALPAAIEPTEEILRSLVLLLQRRPYAEQEQQSALALARNPGNPRALYAQGVVLAASGRFGRAREIVEALVDPLLDAVEARRLLVRVRTQTGEFEAAREVLSSIEINQWGVADAFGDLELLLATEQWGLFEERLALHHARHPGTNLIGLAEAQFLALTDIQAAGEVYQRLIDESPDPAIRDLAAALRYRMQVDSAISIAALGESNGEDLVALREAGYALRESLELPRARGMLAWKLGLVLIFVGPAGQGFDSLELALALLPGEVLLRADYIEHCLGLAGAAPDLIASGDLDEGTDRYLLSRARTVLGHLLGALQRGDTHGRDEERAILARHTTRLIAATSDWSLLIEARDLFASVPASAEYLEIVERASETFEALYGVVEEGELPGTQAADESYSDQ
jgi:tetratricopeptide (TPR) repeat protein